jgi:hypothetical protein
MAGVCSKCGDPKPRGRGRKFCDPCREISDWEIKTRWTAIRRLNGKPCSKCGGAKPHGAGRRFCDACRKDAEAPRMCARCEVVPPHSKLALYCKECRRQNKRDYEQKRYAAVRTDPDKWQERLEQLAAAKRGRVRRKPGPKPKLRLAAAKTPRPAPPPPKPEHVPCVPLGRALKRLAEKHNMRIVGDPDYDAEGHRVVCEEAGLQERTVYGWRVGERQKVRLGDADAVLTRLDLLWWEVWNEETTRLPLRVWTYGFNRKGKRTRRSLKTYLVDLGPDLEELENVRRLFEGEPVRSVA